MQNPENTPAVEDAGTIGEESVFVETPEHAAERLGDEAERIKHLPTGLTPEQLKDPEFLRSLANHPSRGQRIANIPVEELERRRDEDLLAAGLREPINNPEDLQKLRTATGQLYTDQPSVAFHDQALYAVQQEHHLKGLVPPANSDLFVVWFAKVLGNWKALVGQKSSTNYYEVSFNGAKQEAYVDRYVKGSNTVVPANLIEIRV